MSKYIDPFSDIGFKALFGKEGQSEEILREFLNEVFRGQPMFEEIKSVTFLNNERTKENPEGKTIIHDILCTTDSGQRFIVEMQKSEQVRFLLRAIYYVARGISDQGIRVPGQGSWEYDLLPVAGVFLTTFPIYGLPDKLLLHLGLADVDTGELVAKHMRLAFIQTPFFDKKTEEECKTKFDKIIYTLKNMPTLVAIPFQETQDDIFARMDEAARYAALSPEEKMIYDYELKKERDRASQLSTALQKGLEEGKKVGLEEGKKVGLEEGKKAGLEEGKKAEKILIARNLLEMGMSSAAISRATGLSESEISQLG